MHAETLRMWGWLKLPFAGYSVVTLAPSVRSLRLSGTIPTPLAPRATSRQADEQASRAEAPTRREGGNPRHKFAGGHRIRVTPVPIPNTEVKPDTADGTAWETAWESRSLPALFTKGPRVSSGLFPFVPTCRGTDPVIPASYPETTYMAENRFPVQKPDDELSLIHI